MSPEDALQARSPAASDTLNSAAQIAYSAVSTVSATRFDVFRKNHGDGHATS